jgi:GT2 family glycosyltransferase
MSLFVVILNWNGKADTLACLNSLLASEGADFRVVVCDNGSSDGSLGALASWGRQRFGPGFRTLARTEVGTAAPAPHERFFLIDNAANLGFAGGNNVGLRWALSDPACRYVWLLNNDTEVAPDALAQALSHLAPNSDMGLCGSTLVYAHDRQTVQAWGGSAYSSWSGRTRHLGAHSALAQLPTDPAAVQAEMACVVGAAMLVRREWLETVGLLGEGYFLYFEEMDWAARAARTAGRLRLGWAPRSIVFHKEGASIGTAAGGGSALSAYYLFRNRVRFAWTYNRARLPVVLALTLLDVAKLAGRARWPQARAALRGTLQLART